MRCRLTSAALASALRGGAAWIKHVVLTDFVGYALAPGQPRASKWVQSRGRFPGVREWRQRTRGGARTRPGKEQQRGALVAMLRAYSRYLFVSRGIPMFMMTGMVEAVMAGRDGEEGYGASQ